MGSRGGKTSEAPPMTRTAPNEVRPMDRSVTPNAPMAGQATPARPMPGAMPARSSFASGLMGGLIGAGIGGMLFGGGFFGHGLGFGGLLGFLVQAALIFFVGRFLLRMFMNRGAQPAMAGGPNIFARNNPGLGMGQGGMAAPPAAAPAVQIAPADFQAFEQLLTGIQAAWSAKDLNALRGMATPEMVTYFNEQLSDEVSRGVTNTVSAVHLDSGDLSEAWAEGVRQYASVAMRFSMIDVTKDSLGRVVAGSATERSTATEVWTFARAQGGQWILSAIQQAR